jgi:hypothetical protein
MAILPVFAPVGTVAVTGVSEFTVNVVAFTLPKVTLLVCERLTPVIWTGGAADLTPSAGVCCELSHNGIFPCFFGGFLSRLVSSIASA